MGVVINPAPLFPEQKPIDTWPYRGFPMNPIDNQDITWHTGDPLPDDHVTVCGTVTSISSGNGKVFNTYDVRSITEAKAEYFGQKD